jgi:hypothetical protein
VPNETSSAVLRTWLPAQELGGKVAGSCRSLLSGTERARATSETEFATDSLLEGAVCCELVSNGAIPAYFWMMGGSDAPVILFVSRATGSVTSAVSC